MGLFSVGLVLFLACRDPEHRWTPVLEQTSTEFLTTATVRTREHLEAARRSLTEDPEAAAADLEAARRELRHLETYYLPLLEARERAYNAYRFFELGEEARTVGEIERVEALLLEMARDLGEPLAAEMEPPLETVADLRAALSGSPERAPELLLELALRLQEMALKGELVLGSG